MKLWLPLLVLLAGCATAPVTTMPSSTTSETTTTVATTSPRIDTPRKLAGADPCRMLAAEDFDQSLNGTPQPYPDIPRSCAFRVGSGAETDLVVLVAFAEAYAKPGKALEMLIGDGHSAATSCAGSADAMECTTLVAVNATESLKIIAHLRDGNADQVASISQGYAAKAFERVAVTS
ncbi:hypothetical protein ACIA8G_16880 [Lentzea sp. NPDC051213]|uniref:hypothetical protein n=1 Tax=Lentzea sp. NPDC051213 TaxID=3364126 RepID=UPI0037B1A1ED